MKENDSLAEFGVWCGQRGVEFKNTKAGRGQARQCFKVWYLSRAEHNQKIREVRRELEWLQKELKLISTSQ